MIRPIDLDVLAPQTRAPRAGLALLSLAVALAAALTWRFALVSADAAALEERVDAAYLGARATPGALAVRASGDFAADLKRAQGALGQLAAPWNGLFEDLERAVSRSEVGLLGVQPELAAGRVVLVAEAKSIADALAFTERLNEGKVLADAFLAAHEVRAQDPQRPVRFTVSARWAGQGS
jgi:hypothetical protein